MSDSEKMMAVWDLSSSDSGYSRELLASVQQGDSQAAQILFARYLQRLMGLARHKLSPALQAKTDPEDLVISAYRSFFRMAQTEQIVWMRSGDLWRLLATITARKIYRHASLHLSEKRNIHREVSPEILNSELLNQEWEPGTQVEIEDEVRHLYHLLNMEQQIVLLARLEDQSLEEIASHLGKSERTVRRILDQILQIWSRREAELRN